MLLVPTAAVVRVALQRERPVLAKFAVGDEHLELRTPANVYLTANVKLGTPGQDLRVTFNAAVPHSWVPTVDAVAQTDHYYYVPGSSATHSWVNRDFNEDGVGGRWARDVLSIGGLRVESFEFGVARTTQNYSGFASRPYDGTIGLGLELSRAPSWLFALAESGQIEKPIFAFYLGREGEAGELSLGGPSADRHVGKLHFVNVQAPSHLPFWMIPIDALWIGDTTCFTRVNSAIVNPWDSSITGPKGQVMSFLRAWGATETTSGWTINCDHEGAPLIFRVLGRDYVLTKADLLGRYGHTCSLAISPREHDDFYWILGLPFTTKFYTVFDAGDKRIGLAQARHERD